MSKYIRISIVIPKSDIMACKSETAMRSIIRQKAQDFEESLLQSVGLLPPDSEIAHSIERTVA